MTRALVYAPTLALLALVATASPTALHAQQTRGTPSPRADSLRMAQRLDADAKHGEARAIFQALIDNAPDPAAKAAAQRRLAMSYGYDGNCARTIALEEQVLCATRGLVVFPDAVFPDAVFHNILPQPPCEPIVYSKILLLAKAEAVTEPEASTISGICRKNCRSDHWAENEIVQKTPTIGPCYENAPIQNAHARHGFQCVSSPTTADLQLALRVSVEEWLRCRAIRHASASPSSTRACCSSWARCCSADDLRSGTSTGMSRPALRISSRCS